MNKLLLKPQLYIEKNGIYYLEGILSCMEIFVLPNVDCTLFLENEEIDQNLHIHVQEQSHVFYQSFLKNSCSEVEVFLEGYGACFEFVYSMIASKNCGLQVQIFHTASHTKSILHNRIVNFSNDLVRIQVDANVPKGVVGCHLTQDNRILLVRNGKGEILPNLWIDEFDCFAEHSAYISKFQKEEMFYLLSRGISMEDACFLLTKSLLLGKMELDEEFQSKFTERIQDMGR